MQFCILNSRILAGFAIALIGFFFKFYCLMFYKVYAYIVLLFCLLNACATQKAIRTILQYWIFDSMYIWLYDNKQLTSVFFHVRFICFVSNQKQDFERTSRIESVCCIMQAIYFALYRILFGRCILRQFGIVFFIHLYMYVLSWCDNNCIIRRLYVIHYSIHLRFPRQ